MNRGTQFLHHLVAGRLTLDVQVGDPGQGEAGYAGAYGGGRQKSKITHSEFLVG